MSQQELSELVFLTKGAVTQVTKKLADEGYVNKVKSETDGRQYLLILTEKGENILPTLEKILKEWEESIGIDKLDENILNILTEIADKSIELNMKK